MARGLFLNTARTHGHVNPTIGLVKELVKRGDEVVYVSSAEFKEKLEKAGAKYVTFHAEELEQPEDMKEFNMNKVLNAFKKTNELVIEAAMEESGTFDYLVYDEGIKISKVFLEKFNIKRVIALSTAFAMNSEIFREVANNFKIGDTVITPDEKTLSNIEKQFIGNEYADLNIVFTSK